MHLKNTSIHFNKNVLRVNRESKDRDQRQGRPWVDLACRLLKRQLERKLVIISIQGIRKHTAYHLQCTKAELAIRICKLSNLFGLSFDRFEIFWHPTNCVFASLGRARGFGQWSYRLSSESFYFYSAKFFSRLKLELWYIILQTRLLLFQTLVNPASIGRKMGLQWMCRAAVPKFYLLMNHLWMS